jgi:hypothetical protein
MSAHDTRKIALVAVIAICVTTSAPAMTFDVFDLTLADGWRPLSQSAGERSWSRLNADRAGLIVTLYRSASPFEQDPSAKAGRVVTQGAVILGGLPATAYEWQSAGATSTPLHFLVRCTSEPLNDGKRACAMAGTAGTKLEPHRLELAHLLDGIGIARAAATPSPPPPPRPVTPDGGTARVPVDAGQVARIEVSEQNGLWVGVWTLRPNSNIYDAVWRSPRYPEVHDVIRIAGVSGNTIVFTRDGNGGRYTGTVNPDGTITGTASWYSAGMTWSGRVVRTDGGSTGVAPAPIRRVAKLVDNWNADSCELTDTARFSLSAATQITKVDLWYNWRAAEASVSFELLAGGRRIAGGKLGRGTCDPAQAIWCSASATLEVEVPAGTYALRVARSHLCQNAGNGHNGFIRLLGMQ